MGEMGMKMNAVAQKGSVGRLSGRLAGRISWNLRWSICEEVSTDRATRRQRDGERNAIEPNRVWLKLSVFMEIVKESF